MKYKHRITIAHPHLVNTTSCPSRKKFNTFTHRPQAPFPLSSRLAPMLGHVTSLLFYLLSKILKNRTTSLRIDNKRVLKYTTTVHNSIMCIAKRIQSVMMHINHNESKQHHQLAQPAKVVTHLVQPPVLNRRGGRMISLQGKSG